MPGTFIEVLTDDGKFPQGNYFAGYDEACATKAARFGAGMFSHDQVVARGIRVTVREHVGDFSERGRLRSRLIRKVL